MYSIRRDSHHCYSYSQSWSMNQQQQQQFIFPNRQMIKTKQQYFYSTKVFHHKDMSMKITETSSYSQDVPLPVYRAPCTFQNSCKDVGYACHRSPLSSTSSSCVPDVYSPGPTSSGNCSPPPPSSNLPPPPSEWLD